MSSHDLLLSWPFVLLISVSGLLPWTESSGERCGHPTAPGYQQPPQHSDCTGRYSSSSAQLRVKGQFPGLTLEQVSNDWPADQPRVSSQGHDGMSMCLGSSERSSR